MYGIIFICAVVATLAVVGQLLERRRRRRIVEMIAASGGKFVKTKFTSIPSFRHVVDYIGPDGELRRASLLRGANSLSEDQPFQLVLKEQYQKSKFDQLAALKLTAQYSQLPGFDEYKALLRELAAGSKESVTIEETPSSAQAKWGFAPVLQCIETMSITSDANSEHLLDLVVDGKNLNVLWSIKGESPHRLLKVTAVG